MPKHRIAESQSVHPSDSTIDSGQNQSINMDDYICPLCETECTCSRPKLPVLKIKLTVPPSMVKSDSDSVTQPPKRKRGRPPKALASAPTVTQQLPKRKPGRPRKNPVPPLSDRFPTFVSASALSASNSSASDASDSPDDDVDSEIEKEEEKFIRREQRQRGKREKKVERARVRRQQQNKTARRESGRQYQHQQAKRESNQGRHDLFHSDDGDTHFYNEWVIRTRRPSDAGLIGMDIDASSSSTASSDSSSDEEEEDDDGEDADEEPEEAIVDAAVEDEEDDGPTYTGLATGWSDSEESSFDADLFFANLSDSHSSHEGSDDDGDDTASERDLPTDHRDAHPTMEFGGQMEFEVTEAWDGQLVFTNGIHHAPSFGFEGIFSPYNTEPSLDAFIETLSPPPSQSQTNTDADVQMDPSTDVGETAGMSSDEEAEYNGNTTDEDLVGPDQLPNGKALRMFRLPHPHSSFDAPFSFDLTGLSGVDPLSTVSPSGSPVPRNRIPAKRRPSLLSGRVPFSPSPSDILTGNVRPLNAWGAVDEIDEDVSMSPDSSSEFAETRGRKRVDTLETIGPVARPFSQLVHDNNGEVFVVDDEHKVAPSPYHKKTFYPRRRKLISGGVRKQHSSGISLDEFSNLSSSFSHHNCTNPSSMPPIASDQDMSSSLGSLLDLDHTSSASDVPGGGDSPPTQMIEQIALDDVLDVSFMEDEGASDHSITTNAGSSLSHARNLSRWDLISVAAFRRTREGTMSDNGGWGSDTPADYGNVMRSSPLNAIVWSNRLLGVSEKNTKSKISMTTSPLLSPFRYEDEYHPSSGYSEFSSNNRTANEKLPFRGRKEGRRDRKLRRKHASAVHQHHQHHLPSKNKGGSNHPLHQHHTHHHHHPNSKTRSASSSQRTSFFASGSASPFSL